LNKEPRTENREPGTRQRVSVVIVGHVDHGKSTLVGRLLADAGGLPDGKIEAIRAYCTRNSRPFEYAFILDALKDEQSQGITIDSARCFFKTALRDYIIIDAPGHIEFLKNMVSGAARADAALLVIDAQEGVRENSRRHGYFLSMLGIDQFAVVINKMDLVGYDQNVFNAIEKEYRGFLGQIGMKPLRFIPVNSRDGVHMIRRSAEMPWYTGPSVLELFDQFVPDRQDAAKPLRIPVQDVYKFTAMGDDRRIIAGRIESGTLKVGDTVVFSPSNKRTVVKSFETFGDQPPTSAGPGQSVGVTLAEQIYVTRGEMISRDDQPPPCVTSRFRVDLFWLGRQAMTPEKTYTLKLGAAEVQAQVEQVVRILDASTLDVSRDRQLVQRHEVAECILRTRRPVAFDVYSDVPRTGRFVVVDDYQIAGGGIVREAMSDDESQLRQEVFLRDKKWIRSEITPEMRAERFGQQAALIVITGAKGVGRKQLARNLEQNLFGLGRMVYYLGMGSVIYGVDADILASHLGSDLAAREHIRRFGEVLHVLIDAGLLVICTALNLSRRNLKEIETLVNPARMISIRVGGEVENETDLHFSAPCDTEKAVPAIVEFLKKSAVLP
jgi:bifunctional enzyme CysN/CysC